MKRTAIFVAALLALSTAALAGKKMTGPRGVLMGLLVDPPSVGHGVVVRCDDAQLRATDRKILDWKVKVTRIRNDENRVGETAARLANAYKDYPVQAAYFREMASAINGNNGFTAYLNAILRDLDKASQCMWDPRYVRSGCRHIPEDCLYEANIEARILQSEKATQALIDNLNANQARLMSGLPVVCTVQRQVCQPTMARAIAMLIRAQTVIQGEY